MAYAPSGFLPSEVGDIELVADGDELHLFHLTLPNHDVVGHAVSRDGIEWEPRPPILRTGDPGAIDDDQIWTMGIASTGGRHHMLYTALDRAGHGRVQRTALAISDDLEHWEKQGLVCEADPARYETEGGPWVSWRDPKPVRVGDEWLAPICARDVTAPWLRRGAVGLMRSTDLRRWTAEGPILSPRRFFELECPQLVESGDRWFLIASVIEDRSVRYWVGESPRGPFRTPIHNELLPRGAYAARVVRFGDRDLLFAVHERDEGGHTQKVVSSPLTLRAPEASLACSFGVDLWTPRFDSPTRISEARLEPVLGNPHTEGLAVSEGAEMWALPGQHEELWLDVDVVANAGGWGLFFGRDEEGSETLLEVDNGMLRLVEVRRADEAGRPWFSRRVLQERPLFGISWAGKLSLRVSDGEIEIAFYGSTELFCAAPARRGRCGLFVECGTLEAKGLTIRARK